MNKYIKNKIVEHAILTPDQESCGLICYDNLTGKVSVVPCKNNAQDKRNKFLITTEDFQEAEKVGGRIIVVYHSHIQRNPDEKIGFSSKDIEICNESQIPFLLVTLPNQTWDYIEPEGYERIKLLKRPYLRGMWDCYLSLRDWYEAHDICLPYHFPPEDNSFKNYDYFERNYEEYGFEKVELKNLKYGDAMLFKYGDTLYANHCGVYTGGNQIFHHPTKGISSVIDINESLMQNFAFAARHKDFKYGQSEVMWKTR